MRGYGDLSNTPFSSSRNRTTSVAFNWAELGGIIHHDEDQVLFVDLEPSEGLRDRVITALSKPYTAVDSSRA